MSETSAISGQETIQESFVKRINALQSDNKSLDEELETTRMEREEVRAKLFESLIANKKYLREVERLKKENILLKRMPLFLATVMEMGSDYVLLRQHGNNQEFITNAPPELLGIIQTNSRVAINNSLTILRVLDRSVDVRAKVMELVEAPDVSYEQVGGLESQIQEIRETVELPLSHRSALRQGRRAPAAAAPMPGTSAT